MSSDDERERARARLGARRSFRALATTAVLATIVLNIVWAAGGGGSYWPLWPTIAFAIALLFSGVRAYGRPDKPISDDEIEREVERERKP